MIAKENRQYNIYEDDIVIVYDKDDKVIYQGMEDYEPNKYEGWIWNEENQYYTWNGLIKVCVKP